MKKIFRLTLFLSIILNFGVPSILQNLILRDWAKVDDYPSSNPGKWSPAKQVPEFESRTWPPVMIADQNGTVHAFSSQWIGEGIQNHQVAILYNHWSIARGWTKPSDIILPAQGNEARIMDALLDQQGIFHIILISGDNTDYNIYYSKAPVEKANQSTAWSALKIVGSEASDVLSASFQRDFEGNLYLLYVKHGMGVNFAYSTDDGKTWSEPQPISKSVEINLIPAAIHLYLGQSGILHAIWNLVTSEGQGREIVYSQLKAGEFNWSDPVILATAPTGYGTNTPNIIENKGEVFAIYNVTPRIMMRRSKDGGATWGNPTGIFSNHIGVNGNISMVIDSDDDLHLFSGQRTSIRGQDIHGMWHSQWENEHWTEPDSIVSGPRVVDTIGNKGYDPYDARAVISRGNTILVTWHTDYASIQNGIWYSYTILNVPELKIPPSPTFVSNPQSIDVISSDHTEATQTPYIRTTATSYADNLIENPRGTYNYNILIILSGALVLLCISFFVAWKKRRS